MRLSRRFTLAFIFVGLLPLFGLALIAYDFTKRAVTNQVQDQLASIARVQRNRIHLFYRLKRDQLRLITSRTQLRSHLRNYASSPDKNLLPLMTGILRDAHVAQEGDADVLSVVSLGGAVIASTDRLYLGKRPPDSEEILEQAKSKHVFGELFLDDQSHVAVNMYGPFFDRDRRLVGLAWVRTHLDELESIATDYTGLGQSGETLLISVSDGESAYLTPVRFSVDDGSDVELDAPRLGEFGALPFTDETVSVREFKDYRGVVTLAGREYSPELKCGIIVKIDRSEALGPINQFAQVATWTAIFSSITVIIIASLLAASITRPLKQLTKAAEGFQDGDLSKQIGFLHQEEVDKLGDALVGMAERLVGARKQLELEAGLRRSVVDSALDSVISVDVNGTVTLWNPQAEAMFGWSEQEAMGRPLGDLVKPTKPAMSIRESLEALIANQDEAGGRVEYELRRKNGQVIDVEMTISEMLIDEHAQFCIFIHETTDTKVAQRQLRLANLALKKKNEEIRQLLYTVSHDLKSPLVTCKGFIDVMREDIDHGDLEELPDSMARIQRAVARMDQLIDDLLQISRIGTIPIQKERIDVNQLVQEIVDSWRMQIDASAATVSISDDLPDVWADRMQTTTVFENLVANAIKYGCRDASPAITIEGERGRDEVRFVVRDNGMGIAPEFHDKIFRLFQRLESTEPGSGVGLAAVARILEVHGGRTWVESAKDEGAAFWVAFPIPPDDDTARELGGDDDSITSSEVG